MTLPCTFYQAGNCRSGAKCKFSHDSKAVEGKAGAVQVPLPCKFFRESNCKAGKSCRFSHDLGLKMPKANSIDMVCKYFNEVGYCSDGKSCPFIHDRNRAAEEKKRAQEKKRILERQKIEARKTATYQHVKETTGLQLSMLSLSSPKKAAAPKVEVKQEDEEEEEVFFYGAPGEFQATEAQKPSYTATAVANVPDQVLQTALPAPTPKAICKFYSQGTCRYGTACRFSHSAIVDQQEVDLVAQEVETSKELECGICYEVVLDKPNERFGLLSGCSHAFCLSCLRNWRGMDDQAKDNLRQCPLCRVETYFIVPCNRMISDPERKTRVCEEYIENLHTIPCRHFDQGQGTCPFGSSCFYLHQYPDGTMAQHVIRTATNAEGNYDVVPQVRLADFM